MCSFLCQGGQMAHSPEDFYMSQGVVSIIIGTHVVNLKFVRVLINPSLGYEQGIHLDS